MAVYLDFENLHIGLVEVKYGEGSHSKQEHLVTCLHERTYQLRSPLHTINRVDGGVR